MFGIGPMEFVVIAVVAVLFVGPDKLPDVLKKFGRFYVQAKRHANDVKAGFDDAIHAAERELELERIRELQREITKLTLSTSDTVVDAKHTDLSDQIQKESLDDGHTADGRLIAAGNTQDGSSALPPGEHADHEHARAHESTSTSTYHEGHLPAHIPNEDRDPFAADVLTTPGHVSQDNKKD